MVQHTHHTDAHMCFLSLSYNTLTYTHKNLSHTHIHTFSLSLSLMYTHTAPEAAPDNIIAEALDTDKIKLSWSPPPPHLQNGVIHSYSVLYTPTTNSTLTFSITNVSDTEVVISHSLEAGVSYNISVAAVTVARGPYSEGVVQTTYPLPPSISGPPIVVPGVELTPHTLAVQLPLVNISQFRYSQLSNAHTSLLLFLSPSLSLSLLLHPPLSFSFLLLSLCSHFWVVVVKIDGNSAPQALSPNMNIPSPPQTDSLSPPDTPYVVAEMSSHTYQQMRHLFVIGDPSSTQEANDYPDLYQNLPLEPGSTYTALVRGFSPVIPLSKVRQSLMSP